MQSVCYRHLIFPFAATYLLTIYFAWKEKEKGLEPAEVSKQLTTLNLINAVFYIRPKALIKEMVTLRCYFYCNGQSSTKNTGQTARNMSQDTGP